MIGFGIQQFYQILSSLESWGLDLNKLAGQGYDGASTMTGHIIGVQKRIKDLHVSAWNHFVFNLYLTIMINESWIIYY